MRESKAPSSAQYSVRFVIDWMKKRLHSEIRRVECMSFDISLTFVSRGLESTLPLSIIVKASIVDEGADGKSEEGTEKANE